jgi:hypothetical protein
MLTSRMPTASLRIVVFDLPPLLRDLVLLALDPHQDIVTLTAEPGELDRVIVDDQPDAIIVPLDVNGLLGEARRLLEDRARLRVLGVGLRDGRSVLFELRPFRSELGEVAPNELPDLLRAALAGEPTF